MAVLTFFVPSTKRGRAGKPMPLDGTNELVSAERGGYGAALRRKNGRRVERICREAMDRTGWKMPSGRCKVTFLFVEPHNRRDVDNVHGCVKFILDGMTQPRGRKRFGAGAIRDDSQSCIDVEYGPIAIDKDRPGCWVKVEEERCYSEVYGQTR